MQRWSLNCRFESYECQAEWRDLNEKIGGIAKTKSVPASDWVDVDGEDESADEEKAPADNGEVSNEVLADVQPVEAATVLDEEVEEEL